MTETGATKETKAQWAARMATEGAKLPREIEIRRVAGSGGRMRTVAICENGCWHGNRGQAIKCKNARIGVAQAAGVR